MQELKRVNWERSKRFSYGSLVGVSHDSFENVVFVTVVARDTESLKRGSEMEITLVVLENGIFTSMVFI